MSHIDTGASKKCYATMWSYGEICVHCNCCGKREKGLAMWEARLCFHEECFKEFRGEGLWWSDDPETRKMQEKNRKSSACWEAEKIIYCKKKIREWKERIKG